MKKILLLITMFLVFPFVVNAKTLPRIKELTIEGVKIELKENVFTYDAIMTRDGYMADIDIEIENGLTYEITGASGIQVGTNEIIVTISNEENEKQIYLINLTKKAEDAVVLSGNNRLESLTIENVILNFDPEQLEYRIKVGTQRKLKIRYETESDSAVAYINGNYALEDGSIITIKVTAESGAVREYKLIVQSDYVQGDDGTYKKEEDYTTIICVVSASIIALILLVINLPRKKKEQ